MLMTERLLARVKAKLVADKATNLTRVDVDTTNRVVSLNGIVQSREQKNRADNWRCRSTA
jgi:osmotically-inducible protein OsmY